MSDKKTCQQSMGHTLYGMQTFECGKPAKAYIKDSFRRIGWGGKKYLCGVHARAHDRVAIKYNRDISTKL